MREQGHEKTTFGLANSVDPQLVKLVSFHEYKLNRYWEKYKMQQKTEKNISIAPTVTGVKHKETNRNTIAEKLLDTTCLLHDTIAEMIIYLYHSHFYLCW